MSKLREISSSEAVGFRPNKKMNKRMIQKKLLKRILHVSYTMLLLSLLNCPPVMAAEAPANAVKAAKDIKETKSYFLGLKEALLGVKGTCFFILFFSEIFCLSRFNPLKSSSEQLICSGWVLAGGGLIQLLKRLF